MENYILKLQIKLGRIVNQNLVDALDTEIEMLEQLKEHEEQADKIVAINNLIDVIKYLDADVTHMRALEFVRFLSVSRQSPNKIVSFILNP